MNKDTLQQVSFTIDLVNLSRQLEGNASNDIAAEAGQVDEALRAIGVRRKSEI